MTIVPTLRGATISRKNIELVIIVAFAAISAPSMANAKTMIRRMIMMALPVRRRRGESLAEVIAIVPNLIRATTLYRGVAFATTSAQTMGHANRMIRWMITV